jgi:mannan polymerase II complex MNN10 subunit
MFLKRKYAHEWRESWEKIDTIKDVMRQYPHHEWFWWLDLVRRPLSLQALMGSIHI